MITLRPARDTMRAPNRPYGWIARCLLTDQWTDHGRALHALRRLTARHLLFRWSQAGGQWLVLNKGVCEVRSTPDDSAPCWALDSREAEQILTASVAMGHRYAGWDRSSRWAMRESGAVSIRCESCALSGDAGEVVARDQGGFDDYPPHVTHACLSCGAGWAQSEVSRCR